MGRTTATEDIVDAVRQAIDGGKRLRCRGGGSKSALSTPRPGETSLDLSALTGIVEHDPDELTVTVRAGTRLTDLVAHLAEHGQYLPFDPPFARRGATLGTTASATVGGTVAAGLAGAGRLRWGGVRDYLIGVRFVDGTGQLARGGGRVVKNAAGFDIPKLMVGSLGGLAALTELTFKVFPRPRAERTLRCQLRPTLRAAELVALLQRLAASPLELDALEVESTAGGPLDTLWVRWAGLPEGLEPRSSQLRRLLEADVEDVAETNALETFEPPTLVRVPLTPGRLADLEAQLAEAPVPRRYGGGAQQLWLAWDRPLADLDRILRGLRLRGLVLWAPEPTDGSPWLGTPLDNPVLERVERALNPHGVFPCITRSTKTS